ncbi:MAG: ribosomal RNA small subunit methyltransferase I, partial [Betaproteobacteria bacterium]
MKVGSLFLVPTPLDFGCDEQTALETSLPEAVQLQAAGLTYWISENARSTRACLKRISQKHPLARPLQDIVITQLPQAVHKRGDHEGHFDARHLLEPAVQGHDMGLVCEAGMPAIADPGASVVRAAHALGISVR